MTTPTHSVDLVCQKARIIVHEAGSSHAPSESSGGRGARSDAGRTTTTALRARNDNHDVLQIQRVLQRNPELADVVSWHLPEKNATANVIRRGGCRSRRPAWAFARRSRAANIIATSCVTLASPLRP